MQVLQMLRDKPKAWHLGLAGSLVSQEREYKALLDTKNIKVASLHNLPCFTDTLLKPLLYPIVKLQG